MNVLTRQPDKMTIIYSDLHRHILDVFNEEGVEIASPHITQLRDGNDTNIPESYLPENYKSGAFRIFPFTGDK